MLIAVVAFSALVWAQMATADRVREPGFWPTKGSASRKEFVGSAACAPCHPSQGATQPTTSMALTARPAAESEVLPGKSRLEFRSGSYAHAIAANGGQLLYSVSDGRRSASTTLLWAFGVGRIGQTYLFEKDGVFHEARASYFESLRALHFTPGRALASPHGLEEAMGRPLTQAEARRCFGCHTTASTAEGSFDPAGSTPGITCEACHGPGREHIGANVEGRLDDPKAAMLNPARLEPAASVDFCGACHATFWDVTLAGEKGIAALRSQPYRLQSSRCWGQGDARITCIACHDAHRPLVRDAAAYDMRCLSCHAEAGPKASGERRSAGCKVGSARCVTCHMPKYDAPEMHYEFTDHRIARPRQPSP